MNKRVAILVAIFAAFCEVARRLVFDPRVLPLLDTYEPVPPILWFQLVVFPVLALVAAALLVRTFWESVVFSVLGGTVIATLGLVGSLEVGAEFAPILGEQAQRAIIYVLGCLFIITLFRFPVLLLRAVRKHGAVGVASAADS